MDYGHGGTARSDHSKTTMVASEEVSADLLTSDQNWGLFLHLKKSKERY